MRVPRWAVLCVAFLCLDAHMGHMGVAALPPQAQPGRVTATHQELLALGLEQSKLGSLTSWFKTGGSLGGSFSIGGGGTFTEDDEINDGSQKTRDGKSLMSLLDAELDSPACGILNAFFYFVTFMAAFNYLRVFRRVMDPAYVRTHVDKQVRSQRLLMWIHATAAICGLSGWAITALVCDMRDKDPCVVWKTTNVVMMLPLMALYAVAYANYKTGLLGEGIDSKTMAAVEEDVNKDLIGGEDAVEDDQAEESKALQEETQKEQPTKGKPTKTTSSASKRLFGDIKKALMTKHEEEEEAAPAPEPPPAARDQEDEKESHTVASREEDKLEMAEKFGNKTVRIEDDVTVGAIEKREQEKLHQRHQSKVCPGCEKDMARFCSFAELRTGVCVNCPPAASAKKACERMDLTSKGRHDCVKRCVNRDPVPESTGTSWAPELEFVFEFFSKMFETPLGMTATILLALNVFLLVLPCGLFGISAIHTSLNGCPAGQKETVIPVTGQKTCVKQRCPEHTVMSTGSGANGVCVCDLGTGGSIQWRTNNWESTCAPCVVGKYADERNMTRCKTCPRGRSSIRGNTTCFRCREGTWPQDTGGCTPAMCPSYNNYAMPANGSTCKCKAGYAGNVHLIQNPETGTMETPAGQVARCRQCEAGKSSGPLVWDHNYTNECLSGCNVGSAIVDGACVACQQGLTYQDERDQLQCKQCTRSSFNHACGPLEKMVSDCTTTTDRTCVCLKGYAGNMGSQGIPGSCAACKTDRQAELLSDYARRTTITQAEVEQLIGTYTDQDAMAECRSCSQLFRPAESSWKPCPSNSGGAPSKYCTATSDYVC